MWNYSAYAGMRAAHRSAAAGCALRLARGCALTGNVWRVVRKWKDWFERSGVASNGIARNAPVFGHLEGISPAAASEMLP